ncbi:unnamed protein product [Scytosiphon promiscuus]
MPEGVRRSGSGSDDGALPASDVNLVRQPAALRVDPACLSEELGKPAARAAAGGVTSEGEEPSPQASVVAGAGILSRRALSSEEAQTVLAQEGNASKVTDFLGGSGMESSRTTEKRREYEGNSLDASVSTATGFVASGAGKSTPQRQDIYPCCTDAGTPDDRNACGGGSDAESSEDERFNLSVKTDRYGFFVTSERRRLEVPTKVPRAIRSRESKRADKWRTMIDNFDDWQEGRKGARFRSRVRKGVPDCVRGKVWQMMTGSTAMMELEPNKYADLVASDLPVDGPIAEDIPRTMYDHELFCPKSRVNGREMLRRVLTAYGRYDREVQYCQGINYICSLFLLYMPEENAFWMLVATMKHPKAPLRELFLPGMMKAQEVQFVMDSLTEKYCTKLSKQIVANNLTPAMYATQWFLTAFTQRFPYDLVTRVWDMFLLEGWKVFFRICLALFKSVEREAATLDLEKMNMLLRDMPPAVDAPKILDIAASIPLKHRHITKRTILFHASRAERNEGGAAGTL